MSMPSFASNMALTARKHSRFSLVAASAAAAGMLGAVAMSFGAGPTTHTASSVKPGNQVAGIQLDVLRAPGTAGSAGVIAAPWVNTTYAAPAANTAHAAPAQMDAKVTQANAAKAASAKAASAKAAAAKRAAAAHAAAKKKAASPSKPYIIYDSVTPSAIPSGQRAAVYADGSYAASAAQTAGHGSVLWIDTNGSDPNANVLDVEPGDATPAGAAVWAQQRLSQHPNSVAIIYTMRSDWSAVMANVANLPASMQSHVRYWIADPTGVPHVVPGASATQWYWGSSYDMTTALPGFEG
jgi:hypothetical protein